MTDQYTPQPGDCVRPDADHIRMGDGTGWVICPNEIEHDSDPDWLRLAFWHGSDRPCDTCDGTATAPVPEVLPCPDCIDGRYTFTIEVEHPNWCGLGDPIDRYRVSIVPGMVLPIHHGSTCKSPKPSHVCIHENPAEFLIPPHNAQLVTYLHDIAPAITLPPAAQPGMWAVKLKVLS